MARINSKKQSYKGQNEHKQIHKKYKINVSTQGFHQ